MSNLNETFVAAASGRQGKPFKHHYDPNLCDWGQVTLDNCMERGMDDMGGYDCSGLVIASLCDVLRINCDRWPKDYRHIAQMESLESDVPPVFGDVVIYYRLDDKYQFPRMHTGVYIDEAQAIHASGRIGKVDIGPVEEYDKTRTIQLEALVELVK